MTLNYLNHNYDHLILEDESRTIGRAGLPGFWYEKMQTSKLIILEVENDIRAENIYREYIYEEIKKLFEEADSENSEWIEKTSNKLNDIKPLWPEKNITDIANDLSDFEERTEIIHRLSQLPQKVKVEMLAKHLSLIHI